LKAPTGITIHDDHLYVIERDGIGKYKIESGEFVEKIKITSPGFLNDIAIDEKGDIYIVSLWEGRNYLIQPGGKVNKLLDVRSSNIKTADIEFIPELNLIVVPTFDHNRVIAYRLEE